MARPWLPQPLYGSDALDLCTNQPLKSGNFTYQFQGCPGSTVYTCVYHFPQEHWTPLISAACTGKYDVVVELLDSGADVNAHTVVSLTFGTCILHKHNGWFGQVGFVCPSVSVCLSICLSVCLSVLACNKFICSTNNTTYLTHNKGMEFCGIFSENASLRSYSMKTK